MKDEVKVQVIGVKTVDPVEHIVRHFYGTAVMNLITADAGYCLFPWRTVVLREMQVVTPQDLTAGEVEAIRKYEDRGWRCVPWYFMAKDREISSAREVGDRYTWTVWFPLQGECSYCKGCCSIKRDPVRFAIMEDGVGILRRIWC